MTSMKLKYLLFTLSSTLFFAQKSFQTPFEKGNGNQTVTYDEMNSYYQDLAKNFNTIQYLKKGKMIMENQFMLSFIILLLKKTLKN